MDEVLAVGDAEFQRGASAAWRSSGNSGRTVLFVSHQLPAVAQLCDRAILLEGGRVVATARAAEVIANYLHQTHSAGAGSASGRMTRRHPGDDLVQASVGSNRPARGEMPPRYVDVREPVGIEIVLQGAARREARCFPKIKVLDRRARSRSTRWTPTSAGSSRPRPGEYVVDGVDPGQPPERRVGDRRCGGLQHRLPEARAPRCGVRGDLVRGARPGRGRLVRAERSPASGAASSGRCSSGRANGPDRLFYRAGDVAWVATQVIAKRVGASRSSSESVKP